MHQLLARFVIPAAAGIQQRNGRAACGRDSKQHMYLRVADPRQVTFLCLAKENVTKRKATPDYATSLDPPLTLGPALLPRDILSRVAAACIPACGPSGFSQSQRRVERSIRGAKGKNTHLAGA